MECFGVFYAHLVLALFMDELKIHQNKHDYLQDGIVCVSADQLQNSHFWND